MPHDNMYIRVLPRKAYRSFFGCLLAVCLILASTHHAKAWGPDGHEIVVQLAMQFVSPEVQGNIRQVLGDMSFRDAANWMDSMRSQSDYEFMKPWHYIDFAKDKAYEPSTEENIVNRLIIVFNELRHKKILCSEQIKMDLLILFHLMGDIHQPLHTGYDDDLGGNRVAIQYDTIKTNLHHFWDEDLLRLNNITLTSCLAYYRSLNGVILDTIEGIHPVKWMRENRSLLPTVYDFQSFLIPTSYVKRTDTMIIKKRLLLAGLRLASMLSKLFYTPTPVITFETVTATYKNGIPVSDLKKYIGKKVTVCERVYGIKSTDKVTFINVGAKYPNSPLTIVIFAKDRANFKFPIDEMYQDKNICVQGEVVEYKGKAEIIVSKQADITIL
jgi:hypothetical protein